MPGFNVARVRTTHVSSFGLMAAGAMHLYNNANPATGPGSLIMAESNAYLTPFAVIAPCTVTQMWVHNGATIASSYDVGIYTHDGTLLVSSGATAQTGAANLVQVINIADTKLWAGHFYMAIAGTQSGGGPTIFRYTNGAPWAGGVGTRVKTSSYTLPATLAHVSNTVSFQPVMGLTTVAVI